MGCVVPSGAGWYELLGGENVERQDQVQEDDVFDADHLHPIHLHLLAQRTWREVDVHGLGLHALFLRGRLICCASHLHGFLLWPQVLRNYLWNGVHCCEYGKGTGLSVVLSSIASAFFVTMMVKKIGVMGITM